MPNIETAPRISVVIPMKNEEENISPLFAEIETALKNYPYELIAVDDGSDDSTGRVLAKLHEQKSYLRIVTHETSCAKSAALRSGIRIARAGIIAILDGDGQNNPSYLPQMIAMLESDSSLGLVQAERVGRKDTAFKRWQSRTANRVRASLLKDKTMDTNCGMKVFRREVYWELPYFDGLHRFMTALVQRAGFGVRGVDVIDRPRMSGISKYGFFDRLWVGILDLFGVWWLIRRNPKKPKML